MFVNWDTRGAMISPLLPYRRYAFYVRAVVVHHARSHGAVSKMNTIRTDPARKYLQRKRCDTKYVRAHLAPSAPSILGIETISSSQIEILWETPTEPNGKVTHYEIEWIPRMDRISAERDYCLARKFAFWIACLLEIITVASFKC